MNDKTTIMETLKINFLRTLLFIIIAISIISCEKDIKTYKLTIIVSEELGNNKKQSFPEDFQNLCYPIKSDCDLENNFVFSPIFIKRIGSQTEDLKLDIIADERKSNVKSYNLRKNLVIKYFQDNNIGNELSIPNQLKIDYNSLLVEYLNSKSKYTGKFIYSFESEFDSIIGLKIYNSTDSLALAISNYLCEFPETKNIYIVYNPSIKHGPDRDSPKRIIVLLGEADLLFKNGKLQKAKKKYNEVLAIDPSNLHSKQQIKKIENSPPPPPQPPPGSQDGDEDITNITFNYAKYTGNSKIIRNSKVMHGTGTLEFLEDFQIPTIDTGKKRFANKGDKVRGTWVEGKLQQGKRYDKNNQQVEEIWP